MGPEAFLESKVRDYIKSKKGWTGKWVSPGNSGVMDRIITHWACGPFFMELKAPGKRLTDLQEAMAETLAGHGMRVYGPIDKLTVAKRIIDDEFNCVPMAQRAYKPRGF